MTRYIADPDVHVNNNNTSFDSQHPLNSMNTTDSGDIELGYTHPPPPPSSSSSSQPPLPTVAPGTNTTSSSSNGADVHNHHSLITGMARPKQIQRGNSRSGIINCVTTGKEVVRTQSAFVRGESYQLPGTKHERRSSLLLASSHKAHPKPTAAAAAVTSRITTKTIQPKRKHRTRSSSNYSNSSNHIHDIVTSHSSKHGMYMVSSRNVGSIDGHSLHGHSSHGGGGLSETLPSVEQYCLQKVAVRIVLFIHSLKCDDGGTVLLFYLSVCSLNIAYFLFMLRFIS